MTDTNLDRATEGMEASPGHSSALLVCAVLLFASAFSGCAGRKNQEPLEVLIRLKENCEVYRDVPYVTAGDWEGSLDLYYPKNVTEPPPVLLYFHGGGWDGNTRESGTFSILPYIEMGFVVLNVDYRLSQEAPAPAAVSDCRCALRWVHRHAGEYYFDPARVVLAGHSAGGHLALITGFLPDSSPLDGTCVSFGESYAAGRDSLRVAAIVNWFGPTDVMDLIDGGNARPWARRWIGSGPERGELARSVSPVTYVRRGLPPVLTVHGDHDQVVPYHQAVELHRALERAGVPNRLITIRGGEHGGFGTDDTLRAFDEIRRFLQVHGILRTVEHRAGGDAE